MEGPTPAEQPLYLHWTDSPIVEFEFRFDLSNVRVWVGLLENQKQNGCE